MDTWQFGVWGIISNGWTEIGIDQRECDTLVARHGLASIPLSSIRRVVFRDVCASFACESFLILPLMQWPLMPDWGYPDEYLRKRAELWYARPYWVHFLNPLRLLGYPVALLFASRYWQMLRRSHARAVSSA